MRKLVDKWVKVGMRCALAQDVESAASACNAATYAPVVQVLTSHAHLDSQNALQHQPLVVKQRT